jgi:peptidyl-dipeptidase A
MSNVAKSDRRDFIKAVAAGTLSISLPISQSNAADILNEAKTFLDEYNKGWLPLEVAANQAAWVALTDVSESHSADQVAKAQPLNEFVGSPKVIDTVKKLLNQREKLDDLTIRQLEKIRLRAAEAPGTIPEIVKQRLQAEADQSRVQDGFEYRLTGPNQPEIKPSANAIDKVLVESNDLTERQAYWETSKQIGAPLRPGLLKLRQLSTAPSK